MSHYQPYSAYKDSGVEWLGEVPEHWLVKRVCHVASVIDPQPDHRAPALALSEGFPYIGIRDINNDGTVNFQTARKIEEQAIIKQEESFSIDDGDIVFCKVGTLGFPRHIKPHGRLALSATLVLIKPSDLIDHKYLRYALDARCTYGQIEFFSSGSTRAALGIEQIRAFNIVAPSLSEQREISAHLDHETSRIDGLVAKKTRFIKLLREKRQALITHTVTKGLDASAKMKDSGVEWLGDIPEHWDVLSFQRCVSVAEGQVDPKISPFREMVLLGPNHIESGSGRVLFTETAEDQHAESGKYICEEGNIVYSKIRPALRKVCIAPMRCLCSADMYPLHTHSGMSNAFLFWFLLSEPFSAFAVLESDRVAMPKINRESLNGVLLPRPSIENQSVIAVYLDRETTRIDTLISKTERSIELLKERRSALITAAVTGQIDLREFA